MATPERTTYYAIGFETEEEAASAAELLRNNRLPPHTLPFEVTLTRNGEVVGELGAGHTGD